jgi:hypothetical protein
MYLLILCVFLSKSNADTLSQYVCTIVWINFVNSSCDCKDNTNTNIELVWHEQNQIHCLKAYIFWCKIQRLCFLNGLKFRHSKIRPTKFIVTPDGFKEKKYLWIRRKWKCDIQIPKIRDMRLQHRRKLFYFQRIQLCWKWICFLLSEFVQQFHYFVVPFSDTIPHRIFRRTQFK